MKPAGSAGADAAARKKGSVSARPMMVAKVMERVGGGLRGMEVLWGDVSMVLGGVWGVVCMGWMEGERMCVDGWMDGWDGMNE